MIRDGVAFSSPAFLPQRSCWSQLARRPLDSQASSALHAAYLPHNRLLWSGLLSYLLPFPTAEWMPCTLMEQLLSSTCSLSTVKRAPWLRAPFCTSPCRAGATFLRQRRDACAAGKRCLFDTNRKEMKPLEFKWKVKGLYWLDSTTPCRVSGSGHVRSNEHIPKSNCFSQLTWHILKRCTQGAKEPHVLCELQFADLGFRYFFFLPIYLFVEIICPHNSIIVCKIPWYPGEL